jgi:hypothetical protein
LALCRTITYIACSEALCWIEIVEHSLSHLSIPPQISLSTLTTPLTQLLSSGLFLFDSLAFESESDVDLSLGAPPPSACIQLLPANSSNLAGMPIAGVYATLKVLLNLETYSCSSGTTPDNVSFSPTFVRQTLPH